METILVLVRTIVKKKVLMRTKKRARKKIAFHSHSRNFGF
ncbi:hypothetical protein HMPREF9425_1487 [Streptococcus vestibularis ATCC 49124]|uniref:Uncharacterized protein n=1 Tax=Streptococcus vestibularis ATCC 49124 TaxID=889206 RepID=A0ABN0CFA0_STRVE|nr:hypothetical protein HMPREF9425_1487 [Streptococcus vestibularis ATCC 49124]